jgi:hypothetical protein
MRRSQRVLLVSAILIITLASGTIAAGAQSSDGPQPFDLVILLDVSGSLPEADPGGLAIEAAHFALLGPLWTGRGNPIALSSRLEGGLCNRIAP